MITIIIPVYNQRDITVQCIKSVLATKVTQDWRLLVVDDCSTEDGMADALADFDEDPRTRIIRNEKNLGFTKTANMGIALADADSHVLLLNSDTIVYDHWLDAMYGCLTRRPKIATVTPLTNQRGSHISCYPNQCWQDVDTPELVDAKLAELAYRICPEASVDVHTGVGFCLLINREAIHAVGALDEFYFPRGYGEESDFCYRAKAIGWRHLVCGGTFVTHLNSMSFGEEKTHLFNEMLGIFRKLHPTQPAIDALFRNSDPVRSVRRQLDLARLTSLINGPQEGRALEIHEDGLTHPEVVWLGLNGNVVEFRMPGSLGFPNIGPYTLPNDISKLASDISCIGVTRIVFTSKTHYLAARCEELALQLRLDVRLQKKDGVSILTFGDWSPWSVPSQMVT